MKTLWLDPFGGLAGDMLLGGLLDLGVEPDALAAPLARLDLPSTPLRVEETSRRHLRATWARFEVPEESTHRHLPELLERIDGAGLPEPARRGAADTFLRLAAAEAHMHGCAPEEVHFHEVGAADALLEICAVALALDLLGVGEILCGPLPSGRGPIPCAHGAMPAPAPAVLELLEGFEWFVDHGQGEMVTPTGAALVAAYGRPLARGERLHPGRAGYGAGARSESLLRITALQETPEDAHQERIALLETHLDDVTPEVLGYLAEELMTQGALDVAYHPLVMKKGRPGVALTCMARLPDAQALRDRILAETTALGVRETFVDRHRASRELREVETPLGPARVKVSPGRGLPEPEHDDCARLARAHRRPLREVREEVLRAALDRRDP